MQANDMATMVNNWKTPGASDSGRYNTPPLQEDLVPRSRMAPEEKPRAEATQILFHYYQLWDTTSSSLDM